MAVRSLRILELGRTTKGVNMLWEMLMAITVVTSPADSTEHWIFDLAPGEVTIDWSDDAPPRVMHVDSIFVVSQADSTIHTIEAGHYVRFMTGPAPADSIDWVFQVPARMQGRRAYFGVGNMSFYGPPPAYEAEYDSLPATLELDLDLPEFQLQYLDIRVIVFGPALTVFMDRIDQAARLNGEPW